MSGAILVPGTVLSTNVTWPDSALIGSLSAVLCADLGEWPRIGGQGAMLQVMVKVTQIKMGGGDGKQWLALNTV